MPCCRARIQLTLPRSVLISPLWQTSRNGCARSHVGNVLVEKRWCTIASADTMRLVREVEEVLADLVREQHALVDERARRHRRHVELLAVLAGCSAWIAWPERLADDVELALERVLVHVVACRGRRTPGGSPARPPSCAPTARRCRSARRASRAASGPRSRRRARSPARRPCATPAPAAGTPCRRRSGRSRAASSRARPQALRRNASGSWIRMPAPSPCSGSAPVAPRCVRFFENREPLRDDRVALLALDVGDEAQAARVVLVRGVVQTLARRRQMPLTFGILFHADLTANAFASGAMAISSPRPRFRGFDSETFLC